MSFPHLLRDPRSKTLWFFIGTAATMVFYQLTNRLHPLEPKILNFTAIDRALPLATWTVWIYFTEYVIFLFAFFGLKNNENVVRYLYTYMIVFLLSLVCFIFYPVTFPRSDFPVIGNNWSDLALIFLRTHMDTPANCLPSLHVSTCFASAFCFWEENRLYAAIFLFWSLLVAISTMTTKQHYFVDVWTAIALTWAVHYFCFYKLKLH